MLRVLFLAEAVSLAHVARPVSLAQALGDEWDIHFACADRYSLCFKDIKWKRHTIESISPALFLERLGSGSPLFSEKELAFNTRSDLALIEKIDPDIVIGDLRFSLSVAARIAKKPYLTIANAHWSPWVSIQSYPLPDIPIVSLLGANVAYPLFKLFYPLAFKLHARPLNSVRRQYGLPLLRDLREVYTDSDYCLYVDTPGLVPIKNLPASHRYIGPILWSPNIGKPMWWEDVPSNRIVYVTLGTTGHAELLPLVLKILVKLGFIALVATAGRADIVFIKGKCYVADYLDGKAAISRSMFVICNGGSATTYQALACGRPVLGICSNMDQFLTMYFVERAGAGLSIRASNVKKHSLTNLIKQLTSKNTYIEAAQKVQQEFSAYQSDQLFRENLMEIINHNNKNTGKFV